MTTGRRCGWSLLLVVLLSCGPTEAERDCKEEGCPADAACNEGSGQCEALPRCTSSSDCAKGERCVDGVCSSCATNLLCTAGYTACDASTLECKACVEDATCGGGLSRCGPSGCTACLGDADCGGATPHCVSRWCVQCKTGAECGVDAECRAGSCSARCGWDSDCPAATPYCTGGRCYGCRSELDCPSGQACYEGTCRAVLPGDTCRSAIPLALPGGSAVVEGKVDSSFRADSPEPLFSSTSEFTVFYRVTVTEELALNAELTPRGLLPTGGSVTFYRGECGKRVVLGGGGRSVKDVFVTPGSYLVGVTLDTWGTDDYQLRVFTSAASRAVGNHCDKPEELALGAPGGSNVTVSGTTAGLYPVVPDDCDRFLTPLPDRVYAFTLQERSHVILQARPLESTLALDVEVVPADCWARDSQCPSSNAQPGEVRTWSQGPYEPGRYFIHLRTRAAPGPYELSATAIPWASNATCAGARPLSFNQGVALVTGDVRYTDSGTNVCAGNVRQLHYTLSTRGLGERSLVLEAEGAEAGQAPPLLALSRACATEDGSAAARVACTESDSDWQRPKRVEVPLLPEGDYHLQVYAGGATDGPFRLRATLGPAYPAPANDTCTGVLTLTPDANGLFQTTGDTRGAGDDHSDSCSPLSSTRPGRDVAFHVQGADRGLIELTLEPTSPDFDATLHLDNSNACSTTSGYICSSAQGPGGGEHIKERMFFGAFNYLTVWVDGREGTEGTFKLTGRFLQPPAHDVCTGALPLPTDGTAVVGNLEAAFPHSSPACRSLPSAPDLFYAFTAPSNGTATVTLTPTGFNGTLSASTPCNATTQTCHGTQSVASGTTGTLSFAVTRNVQYVVMVSGSDLQSDGTFRLTARVQ